MQDRPNGSRRAFLSSTGSLGVTLWLGTQWSAITAAAHHADELSSAPASAGFEYFSPADAADVQALSAQIVPSGATPGAREAQTVHFIDRALGSFFAAWAHDFAAGLGDFQAKFRAEHAGVPAFAAADGDVQIHFMQRIDRTAFFDSVRMLTIVGLVASPRYGGNYRGSGWQLLGFVDQHAFAPPFGYYDRDYRGFVPYRTDPA